jgi:hypothetical protein
MEQNIYDLIREKLGNMCEKFTKYISKVFDDEKECPILKLVKLINRKQIDDYLKDMPVFQLIAIAMGLATYKIEIDFPSYEKLKEEMEDLMKNEAFLNLFLNKFNKELQNIINEDKPDDTDSTFAFAFNEEGIGLPFYVEAKTELLNIEQLKANITLFIEDESIYNKNNQIVKFISKLLGDYHDFFRAIMSVKLCDVIEIKI